MKKIIKCAIAAISAAAVITASSVPVSAAGALMVFGGSNNCDSNLDLKNFNFNVGGYCPNCSNLNELLGSLGLQNIFGNCSNCGSSTGSNGSISVPGIGFWKPDNTPSKPDIPSADNTPSKPDTDTSAPSTDDDGVSEYEKRVVELVNIERAKYGLSALTLNTRLSAVARAKSQDMKDKNYFSHTSPTYGSPFEMMKNFGIKYNTAGENIAMGYRTPEAVVEGWMNSNGHRANILNSSFKEIGVGYVANGNYWTQMFIG